MTLHAARAAAAAILLCVATAPAALAQNLIRDGGFESPPAPDGGLTRYSTGSSIGKWTVVGENGNVDIINKNFSFEGCTITPKKGNQAVDLTGASNTKTGVQQAIRTDKGATYALTFFVGTCYAPGGKNGTTSTVNVLIDGEQVASLTAMGKRRNTTTEQWTKFSLTFTATKFRTTIAFINGDVPNDVDTNNGLDAVSVELVE